MHLILASTAFWKFPADDLAHWILIASLVFGCALMFLRLARGEFRADEEEGKKKYPYLYAIAYAIGVIMFVLSFAGATRAFCLTTILLGIPTLIVYLVAAGGIRKQEMDMIDPIGEPSDKEPRDPAEFV